MRAKACSLAGPASSAACITFVRPKAKSNCSPVNARNGFLAFAPARRVAAASPGHPVLGRFRRVDEGDDAAFGQSAARPWQKPKIAVPAFRASDRALDGGALQKSVDPVGETGRDGRAALEGLGKQMLALGGGDVAGGRRDPDAAAGKLPPEVGDDLAVRRDHEPDEVVRGLGLASDDAHPFRRLCLRQPVLPLPSVDRRGRGRFRRGLGRRGLLRTEVLLRRSSPP